MSEAVIKITSTKCKGRIFHHGPFLVNSDESEVECEACGKLLNPIAVLMDFCRKDSRYRERIARNKEELQRVEAAIQFKNKVKCSHCKKFTPVHKEPV